MDDDEWEDYEAEKCRLFPRKYDFTNVCNCPDCLSQIQELKDFEIDIKYKSKQHMDLLSQQQSADHICTCLSTATWWTALFLDLLNRNLQEVYEKSGVSSSRPRESKVKEINELISQMRVEKHKLFKVGEDKMEVEPDYRSVRDEIEYGLLRYGCHGLTNVKDTAHGLLKKILESETVLEDQKKSAEEGKIPWDQLTGTIEGQIELLEKMPVEEMLSEYLQQTRIVSHIEKIACSVARAKDSIFNTCRAMIKIRKNFWQKYQTNPKKGHDSSGLKSTLESLKQQVASFREQWEREYASCFPPNPKKRKQMGEAEQARF